MSLTFVICETSRMKRSDASTMPALIAITMSNSTVSTRHSSSTSTSPRGALRTSAATLCASLMFQATSMSSAAIDAIGSQERSGASASRPAITNSAWIMPATGDSAPARKLAVERAMAAVAVMPPKNGTMRLPMPCPSSSEFA